MENKLAPAPWIYSPVKLKVHPVNDDRMTVCFFNSYESEPYISERNFFGYLIAAAPDMISLLQKIVKWELPATGKFWDKEETQPMSYGACYGSNGERDYFRALAQELINKALNK